MPTHRLALTFLAFAACQPVGTAVPVERLLVPEAILLTDAVVAGTTQATVDIHNVGAAGAQVSLRVDPPFFVSTPRLFVAAGGTVRVRIGVRGTDYEPITGTLDVIGPYRTLTVPVSATFDTDRDGDGFAALAAGGTDCDDTRPTVHPDAAEVCNGRDDDCDGDVDVDAVDAATWYRDRDGDGHGDSLDSVAACARPAGFVSVGGDCDDTDQAVRPGAVEVYYDGVDQDCGGGSDFDRDGDGFDHTSFLGSDCNDQVGSIHPGAPEIDDLVDQDCDLLVDEDFLAYGDLVVTEVLVMPEARPSEDGQYVEIVNTTASRTIDLRGMTVETDGGTVVLGSVRLAPGGVALLCANTRPTANGGLTCAGALPGLLDAHDWVRVSSAAMLDEFDWTDPEWQMLPGVALELTDVDPDSNDDPAAWCQATITAPEATTTDAGSPGDAKASCAP